MKATATAALRAAALAAVLGAAQAVEEYLVLIPNAALVDGRVMDANDQKRNLGHNFDTVQNDPFGNEYIAVREEVQGILEDIWPELCKRDSDGDGFTNGEELGDPECTWRTGQPDPAVTQLSNPGEFSDTPSVVEPPSGPPVSPPVTPVVAPTPPPSVESTSDLINPISIGVVGAVLSVVGFALFVRGNNNYNAQRVARIAAQGPGAKRVMLSDDDPQFAAVTSGNPRYQPGGLSQPTSGTLGRQQYPTATLASNQGSTLGRGGYSNATIDSNGNSTLGRGYAQGTLRGSPANSTLGRGFGGGGSPGGGTLGRGGGFGGR